MRVLTIDAEAEQKVKAVIEYASDPRHFYYVEKGGKTYQKPPGDDLNHTVKLDTFRCVFSITKSDGKMWRHLSISVPSAKYPNPFAAFTIAQMFGFTGWDGQSARMPTDWLGRVNEQEHCVVLGQEFSK